MISGVSGVGVYRHGESTPQLQPQEQQQQQSGSKQWQQHNMEDE